MKEEKSNNNEKSIMPEEISKIDPYIISKIILLDGTILLVQNSSNLNNGNETNNNKKNDIGAENNLKSNQIPNSNKKQKNSFSYIEWDFPKNKRNNSFQRNIENELIQSKTEQNENTTKKDNENNSRDSAINRHIKNKNYSFYESKHTKKNKSNTSDIESKNNSCFIKTEENYNYKEVNNKGIINSNKEEIKENTNNANNNNIVNNNINNQENKKEIKNIKKSDNNDNNIKKEKKEEINNKQINKDNLSFSEKIKLLKYGLLDYDCELNSTGLKNEDNNIKKINKIRPLNIIIDKSKIKNDDDINKQFNKLLNKFNENKNNTNKNNTNKKLYEDNSYITNKPYVRDYNINEDINRLNNFIHKNNYNYNHQNLNKKENNKGNSYRDLNERINQLRKKTLNNNLVNFYPSKTVNGKKAKLLVLPSNFNK